MPQLLDGEKIAEQIVGSLNETTKHLTKFGARPPTLAVVMVGHSKASEVYIRKKEQICAKIGANFVKISLPENATEEEIIDKITALNCNSEIDAILVQFPLPKDINEKNVISSIRPIKDVDGIHPENLGKLMLHIPDEETSDSGLVPSTPCLLPCTPLGIMHLLKATGIDLRGKHAVVIGKSVIVGKPMCELLAWRGVTVTGCDIHESDLQKKVELADIVISATGVKHLVKSAWLKEGSIIIDAGIHVEVDDNRTRKIYGDIEDCSESKAAWYTKVPGGVGPMTVAMLAYNLTKAFNMCMLERNKEYSLETDGYELEGTTIDRGMYPKFNLISMELAKQKKIVRSQIDNIASSEELQKLMDQVDGIDISNQLMNTDKKAKLDLGYN